VFSWSVPTAMPRHLAAHTRQSRYLLPCDAAHGRRKSWPQIRPHGSGSQVHMVTMSTSRWECRRERKQRNNVQGVCERTYATAAPRASHKAQPRPRPDAVALCRERRARHGSPNVWRQVKAPATIISICVTGCRIAHATQLQGGGRSSRGTCMQGFANRR
jgi:hypothetical protein